MNSPALQGLELLKTNVSYWFIRTEGGQHFDSFYESDFIAIGWDEITLADLNKTDVEIKSKIARIFKLDSKIRADKTKITDIYNKVLRFSKLKKDDVVIIPSENSRQLAFGIVQDDGIYEKAFQDKDECQFLKRRKVQWIELRDFEKLDDVFYKIRKSRHAISNVSDYAEHIDSEMYSVYKKDDTSHFVVRVSQTERVNWLDLATTLINMHDLMSEINDDFHLQEDVANSSITIAIQSPGLFNLAQKGVALVLLATMLGATSCSEVKGNLSVSERKKLEVIEAKRASELSKLRSKLDTMGVKL
jgi:restriction system protein